MQIEEAVSAFVKEITPVCSSEICSLINATGRILGGDITAGISVPSFPKSAMDGYAVLASDIEGASSEHPVKLQVLECIYAGDKVPAALLTMRSLEGCAVRHHLHYRNRRMKHSRFAVFQGTHIVVLCLSLSNYLLINPNRSFREIKTIPSQANNFCLPHSSKKSELEQNLIAMLRDSL